ncbi:protein of unknown function [Rhodovastum atsumiense]|nr:protein of unknown function [Rhodovastum atsumiense]
MKAGRVVGAAGEAFGQGHHAHRQGDIADQFRAAGVGQAHPGQFGRAAADVEQQGATAAAAQQRGATFQREFRFFPAGDDVDGKSGFLAHAVEELRPVIGAAAGLGGDGADSADGAACEAGSAAMQSGHGAFHRVGAEAAGTVQSFAEADDAAEAVEDAKPVAGGGPYQEPAIIGAKIQRSENRGRCSRDASQDVCGCLDHTQRGLPHAPSHCSRANRPASSMISHR